MTFNEVSIASAFSYFQKCHLIALPESLLLSLLTHCLWEGRTVRAQYSSYKMLVLPRDTVLHRNEDGPGWVWSPAITQTRMAKPPMDTLSPVPILLYCQQKMATQATKQVSPSPLIALLFISNQMNKIVTHPVTDFSLWIISGLCIASTGLGD